MFRPLTALSSGIVVTLITTQSHAALAGLGWTSEIVWQDGTAYTVGRLYAVFDAGTGPLASVLNVYNSNIQLLGGGTFNHRDTTTGGVDAPFGSFSPNAFAVGVGNPLVDTYLAIGGAPSTSGANTTGFDPAFSGGADAVTGGWFNSNPPGLQGKANLIEGLGWATLIGQIALINDGSPRSLDAAMWVTHNLGISGGSVQQTFASGSFQFAFLPVPAPAAWLGCAALAWVGGRRRRR